MRRIVFLLIVASLAGCSDVEDLSDTAYFELAVVDDATSVVEVDVLGAWLQQAGNGTWMRVASNAQLALGSGGPNATGANVGAGSYERLQVIFANVTVDGIRTTLVEDGFELPLNVSLPAGTSTRLTVGFAWTDAVFSSADGLAFQPTLRSVALIRDGVVLAQLDAQEIETAPTKAPVARMEIFDAEAARVFATDFVAESPAQRIIAVGPNLTFQAAPSEAVQAGARLTSYAWDFGDGTTATGPTVSHLYPVSGGNFTVRLTVTDSLGVEDSQTVKMALAPGTVTARQSAQGSAAGLDLSKGTLYGNCIDRASGTGAHSHAFPIDATTAPGDLPADLVAVRVNLFALGTPHAGADLDLRVLDGEGSNQGASGSAGTTEEVAQDYAPGEAVGGEWTVEVWPCAAAQADYQVVVTLTWRADEPEPGYLAWLAEYNDGHDHEH